MARINLTPHKVRALEELLKGPLYRDRAGWARNSAQVDHFSAMTMRSLESDGAIEMQPLGGCQGSATITRVGREALTQFKGRKMSPRGAPA
jgi:uncharacterized ParB-like nuclease family protein